MTIDHKNPETRKAPPQTPEVTKKKLGAKTIALIGGGVVFVAGAAAGLVTALMPREVQGIPAPLPSETFTSGPVTPGPETSAPSVEPSETATAEPTATATEKEPTKEPSTTTPEKNTYAQEVIKQNNESPKTFLKRPVNERLVLISALLAQADEKFPDRYVDLDYNMDLWKQNPLKVASKDNSNEAIAEQYKYMQMAATLGTNYGAEQDTDASLETSQKIAGGLTILSPQEGGKGHVPEMIDRITAHVEEYGVGRSLSYKQEMQPNQDEKNFKCTTSDDESRTCRRVTWKTTDANSTQVANYVFGFVEFTGSDNKTHGMWVPDTGTVKTIE